MFFFKSTWVEPGKKSFQAAYYGKLLARFGRYDDGAERLE